MPAPTTLRGISATAGSNSPADTDVIGSSAAGYLRSMQAVMRQYLASIASNIASAATTDLSTADGFWVTISGTTPITSLGTESAGCWYGLTFSGILTFTHNGTSLILPGAANITTAAGDSCLAESLGSGNWKIHAFQRASGSAILDGVYRSSQIFTGNGTYTAPAGLKRAKVTVVGGGGGSGGCGATIGGQGCAGGGGGAGGASVKAVSAATIGASQTVTIGAGGTAGTSGGGSGGTGGTTSFGAIITATGGSGGTGTTTQVGPSAIAGGAGGIGSSGDYNSTGAPGGYGFINPNVGNGGVGGSSLLGGGAAGLSSATTTSGVAGGNYGGGASGAALGQSQSAAAGSAGAPGIVIVDEFF